MPDPLSPFLRMPYDDIVETHISWVVLAGDFAWKFKKPVTLPFLDYGTVEKRRACCEAEVRLNRRYAPGLYIGVENFDGEPAVKMRRFPDAMRLDRVCARNELTPAHLSGLARTLVDFHEAAAVAPPGSRFGEPAQVLAPALENFEELERLLPSMRERLLRLGNWTRTEAERLRETFAARRAAGRVRECHGDLHLGNLVLLDGKVTPFDCIEFNEDFRWIDVASEVAFAWLDLLDHGRPGLACWLLNEWLAGSGDFGALSVLRFYAAYRALVRAKVAAIQGRKDEAAEYLSMAERIAVPPALTLTITHGLSGCGKTTASTARLLADPEGAIVRLRSDVERKRLFGLPPDADSRSEIEGGIYAPGATERTYARLLELSEAALSAGWPVIADAAFLRRAERDDFRRLAARLAVPFAILAPSAPVEELRRRILARQGTGDASEATLAVLEKQFGWIEPLAEEERPYRLAA
ncbi:MAG: AAA family ATPase [Candidatus Nitricoxidivorans perseverans]|uniref:AAA family ATPase n=1 Tax=Candidatus Nitricoxidivorans perseverans TaxID=2975601 RepID=A0AA49FJK1_9PROT|nr:MAG: AAA family ATPase [Candidatus Nitricoxidivorans perseverans]